MDSGMPMMLPKGIVINAKHIYQEVASHHQLPLTKVQEYWHVYTTTNKQLEDPTARRLENFWWHVWGSDRRFLHGHVLARLYEDISVGPTFVPLRGPPNRWEGPAPPPLIRHAVSAIESSTDSTTQGPDQSTAAKPSDSSKKTLASSTKQPPHPILKKARGPSSSGPRPTARFISPHESADEAEKDDLPASTPTIITTDLETTDSNASAPSPAKKKPHSTGKKFVASTAAAKKRPILPRRASSQSSGSDVTSRDSVSSAGSRGSAAQRAVSPIPEISPHGTTPKSEPVRSSTSQRRSLLSVKALGKRPVVPHSTSTDKKSQAKTGMSRDGKGSLKQDSPALGTSLGPLTEDSTAPTPQINAAIPQVRSLVNLPTHSRRVSEAAVPVPDITTRPQLQSGLAASWGMERSQSDTGYVGAREHVTGRAPNQGLFTGATAATTNIAAHGTIIDQSGLHAIPIPSLPDRQRDGYAMPSLPTESGFLDAHLSPTPPVSTNLMLGRTRSQLTLLLEREKERVGEKPRSKG